MSEELTPIQSNEFVKRLIAAGLLPPECTSFVIESQVDDVVRIHYTTNASEKLLQLDLDGIRFIDVAPGLKRTEPCLECGGRQWHRYHCPLSVRPEGPYSEPEEER